MKILMINTFDRGGAANACLRLHKGFSVNGVDSSILLLHKQKNIPNAYQFKNEKSSLKKIKDKFHNPSRKNKKLNINRSLKRNFLNNRKEELEWFSFPDSVFDITSSRLYKDADIINLHWVANFLDYSTFFKKNSKPVVWTLHDMNPFSGGEHYEEQYLGIDNSGLPIKREILSIEKLIFNQVIDYKAQALKNNKNLHLVTLSKWMTDEVKKSKIFNGFPCYHIPNGLDSKVFKQYEKHYSRTILDIPLDKTIILFVADTIDNNRKGFAYLKKALESLNSSNVLLCSVGANIIEFGDLLEVIHLGEIKDEELMSKVYSAADVFVIPSLMDNLPNTVLESLMCGTPVIGFPVGGIPDMIEHGENGLLTKDVSVSSLQQTLKYFIDNFQDFDRKKISENAVKKYNLNRQAQEYINLFNSLLD